MLNRLLLATALVLCGCSSLEIVLPNPQVEPPETRGESGLAIGPSAQSAHLYKSTNDASERPPTLTDAKTDSSINLAHGVYYAPTSNLDIGGEIGWAGVEMGVGAQIKWQVLGDGIRGAKKGNFPFSVFARAGSVTASKSGDQKGEFGPGGYNWHGSTKGTYAQGGFSLGLRVTDTMLVYLGGAVGQYDVKTEITQDPGSSDPGGSYSVTDKGHAWSSALGFLFSWHVVQFNLAFDYTHVAYNTAAKTDGGNVSGGLRFNF